MSCLPHMSAPTPSEMANIYPYRPGIWTNPSDFLPLWLTPTTFSLGQHFPMSGFHSKPMPTSRASPAVPAAFPPRTSPRRQLRYLRAVAAVPGRRFRVLKTIPARLPVLRLHFDARLEARRFFFPRRGEVGEVGEVRKVNPGVSPWWILIGVQFLLVVGFRPLSEGIPPNNGTGLLIMGQH